MKVFRIARFVALPAALFCGVLAHSATVRAEDAVLAKVNGVDIRESDLKLAEAEIGPEIANIPPANRRRLMLEFLIEMQLFSDAADADKLTSGPDFERRLAYWNTRAKRDAFYDKAVKGAIGEGVMRELYDDKVKDIQPENEVQARHILVETEELALVLSERIKNGEDFDKLAAEFSKDPGSNGSGGLLGYFGKGQMVKEFDEAAFALKKGELSKPVKSQFGWHLIKVEDTRQKPVPTFEDVKAQIGQALEQQKGQQVSKELRDKAKIDYVDVKIREEVAQEAEAQSARQRAFEEQMQQQIKKMEDQQQLEKEAK